MGSCQIAAALAGQAKRLVLIVSGWGFHAKMRGAESVGDLSQTIRYFKNCRTPAVIVVVVSAVRLVHFLPLMLVGSMDGALNALLLSPNDDERLSEWAADELGRMYPDQSEDLLRLAGSQLGAIRAAVHRGRPHAAGDLSSLIRGEHERSGSAIYFDLPECCQTALSEVARGRGGRVECVTALKDAGILIEADGQCVPRVADWAPVFRRGADPS